MLNHLEKLAALRAANGQQPTTVESTGVVSTPSTQTVRKERRNQKFKQVVETVTKAVTTPPTTNPKLVPHTSAKSGRQSTYKLIDLPVGRDYAINKFLFQYTTSIRGNDAVITYFGKGYYVRNCNVEEAAELLKPYNVEVCHA
jgi:hypothetical protein